MRGCGVLTRMRLLAPLLSANLDVLQRLSGFTRVVILSRAAALGLSFDRRRPWRFDEVATLCDCAGRMSVGAIAVKLGRTQPSVKGEIKQLGLSSRIAEGYSQQDLQELLGVSVRSIRRWIALGWLQIGNQRISEASVIRFLRAHPDQYQLSRVEEFWFKGLMFPALDRVLRPANTTGEIELTIWSPSHVDCCTQIREMSSCHAHRLGNGTKDQIFVDIAQHVRAAIDALIA